MIILNYGDKGYNNKQTRTKPGAAQQTPPWLNDWLSHSSFSYHSFMAPPRPNG